MTRNGRRGSAQRGAAVVSALLVVVLATTVVAGLFVRESVTVRSVENRLAMSQTRWIERAALDWAKVILRADARGGSASQTVDHLGEPWAVPVAETRLDETVTAGARISDASRPAMVAGQILDAQARLNLNSLVRSGEVSRPHVEALRKLLQLLGLSGGLADGVVTRLVASTPRTVDGVAVPASALPLVRVTDLQTVPGFDAAMVEMLSPFVVVLPRPTDVNLNTAPPEVISAVIPSLDLAGARRFVARRERTFFSQTADAVAQIDGQPVLPPNMLSVGSSFFIVRGMVRFDRVEASSETLLERKGSESVEIVWQQRY